MFDRQLPNIDASISWYTELENAFGETDEIQTRNRKQISQYLIFKQNIWSKISYNVKVRKDFNSDYDVPFIYSGGLKYNLLAIFI
ncbi:hypothetical protein [Tenacibaculum sp. SG-28]|uniref:hypothetical protein n=1 Tax=Tenacibaculum sp. SG-28 TaxID=754426 RepID=UPI000CF40918|nr:hypothetical protein [Tenacibaculum sp. SG-28]PQJ19900.1 hypothetical protein BSU00_11285 [Tenacibaculum sp. SG-28]